MTILIYISAQMDMDAARQKTYTLPPKSLPIPISVYIIKHASQSELEEGQGEGQHLCKLGTFLTKL